MPSFPPRPRAIDGEAVDLAVIGGGIVGCGVARDAARRGLRVVLFERADFASGTTAASTRIVHGGLRYLRHGDVRLVRLDLRERETLLRIAPHLVKPLEFVIPLADLGVFHRLQLRAGLAVYDALAKGSTLPRRRISRGEAAYYDARIDSPERLAIENLLDAAAHGAAAFNYAEVTGALHAGTSIAGLRVRDRLTGEESTLRARVIVNAGGPWFERVAAALTGAQHPSIRMTKGIHLACQPLTDRALVLFSRVDGRLMFAIPRDGVTWLGTTDTDYAGDPGDAVATAEDVAYVLASLRHAFPSLREEDVLHTRAGVRALVMQSGRATTVSRMHRVIAVGQGFSPAKGVGQGFSPASPGEGVSPAVSASYLVSILGGKITGYRAIAEEATDAVCRTLGMTARATTAEEPLPGGRGSNAGFQTARGVRLQADQDPQMPLNQADVLSHLRDLYGSRAADVMRLAAESPELARPLSPKYPDIGAQVALAAREEYCVTVADFMRRRSLLGDTADQGWDAAPAVADILAGELGWTGDRRERELAAYAQDIARTQTFLSADR